MVSGRIPRVWRRADHGRKGPILGLPPFVAGRFRIRRWVVEDRPGVPRYSPQVGTIHRWLIYSTLVAIAIVVPKQMMRRLASRDGASVWQGIDFEGARSG